MRYIKLFEDNNSKFDKELIETIFIDILEIDFAKVTLEVHSTDFYVNIKFDSLDIKDFARMENIEESIEISDKILNLSIQMNKVILMMQTAIEKLNISYDNIKPEMFFEHSELHSRELKRCITLFVH